MKPRSRKSDQRKRGPGYKILYALLIVVVVTVWGYAFSSYFRRYDSMHPVIAWATPWHEEDITAARGVLLWEESVIASPASGKVSYPMGRGPMRVFKGAVVARVASGNAKHDVKAQGTGYFIAGVDGHEGEWRYTSLWLDWDDLPEVSGVSMRSDGDTVKKGEAIGKLVPQPQELRSICYVDRSDAVVKRLTSDTLTARMDELDTSSRVEVRVWEDLGAKAKAYISLPWFPPEAVKSRATTLLFETGGASGVTVPESAVTMRGGRQGAFVIDGTTAVFRDVSGRVIDGGRFLITDGIVLGEAVVVDGDSAEEGRVNLW